MQLTLNKCTLNKNSINVIKSLINVLSQHFGMLLDINEEETYHEENKQEISIQTVQLESQATTKASVIKLGKS